MYIEYLKHIFDRTISAISIIIFLPILFVIATFVRVFLGSPILFTQQRPGLHGKPFTIYKFRTMCDIYDDAGNILPDKDRLTKFGRFLRKTSLDELPELFNVLKGDMSLVGPRPLLMEYLPRYSKEQARRHDVKPGITGWAQVNGRNAISWKEKFDLDIWYVENISFSLDLKILWQTFSIVIKRQDISFPGHVTMEKFLDSE